MPRCLHIFWPIILFDYSQKVSLLFQLVYPLFQFKDVTFILKDNLFVVVL